MEPIIKVENVSMNFNMADEKVDSLKEYFLRFVNGTLKYKEFTALKEISFTINRGERIGIVGLNGSGKSTLLKLICGVLKPSIGTVTVRGSIAPLIELGAGFDLDLSAKENIYLNGALLGYSDALIDSKYNEIIEFSGLKKFENYAIKNFSSGMFARLGFSIATCTTPDILIIDEILAVGDFEFQIKCHERMDELTKLGTTLLFVSHDANQVQELCDRAIWLNKGELIQDGSSNKIVENYMNHVD